MPITIINGSPDNSLVHFVCKLREKLIRKGVEIKYHDLKKWSVKNCIGCFGCWVKTPGECTVPDDSIQIRRDTINSELIIFISPVIMGFTSALLKNVQDKMIPLIHPYIDFVNNECHHQLRYEKYPEISLIIDKTEDSDEEDYKIILSYFNRGFLNTEGNLVDLFYLKSIRDPGKQRELFMNMYWDKMLKDNNAFARRDEKPYQK